VFGKTQRGVSERPNKPKKPLIPAWLGTLAIILIILSFVVALMLWKPWEPVKPKNQITSEHAPEETNKDYRFYDRLQASAPAQAPNYILQVRSYDDPDQADARRAEIILNGLSADVVQTTENGKVWYRVVSGPYDSQEAAVIAQQTLQHSGIDSIVVKL